MKKSNYSTNNWANKELRLLFDAAKDAAPEDLKMAHSILAALKKRGQGNE